MIFTLNKKFIKDINYSKIKTKFKVTIIEIFRKNGFMESYSLLLKKENKDIII